jgi:hypothetical protein
MVPPLRLPFCPGLLLYDVVSRAARSRLHSSVGGL